MRMTSLNWISGMMTAAMASGSASAALLSIDFESPTVVSGFNQTAATWAHNTTGGVNNSGRFTAPSGGSTGAAVYATGFSGFATHATLELSLDTYFLAGNSKGYSVPFQAFLKSTSTADTTSSLFLKVDSISNTNSPWNTTDPTGLYDVSVNGSSLTTGTTVANKVALGDSDGQWYRWTATWTKDSLGLLDLSLSVSDIGNAGTSTPSLVKSWTVNDINNTTVANASNLYFGVFGRARELMGASRVDNVVVVPEPASVLALIAAPVMLLRRRRA